LDGLALSTWDWWAEAGVDMLVDEQPRDWLARSPVVAPAAVPAVAVEPAAPALPVDLPGFRRWLLADASVPGPVRARHDAHGDPASGCMVVTDMPEPADRGTAQLLTGEPGALFDRMLAAIGLSRDALYLAPFTPARPASGKLSKDACHLFHRLMEHQLALVAPRRLLLLGDAPCCSLLGQPVTQARGRVHELRIGDRTIPTVASFPPRLVEGNERRRLAWADLQLFRELA
jgi:DNA polymerase